MLLTRTQTWRRTCRSKSEVRRRRHDGEYEGKCRKSIASRTGDGLCVGVISLNVGVDGEADTVSASDVSLSSSGSESTEPESEGGGLSRQGRGRKGRDSVYDSYRAEKRIVIANEEGKRRVTFSPVIRVCLVPCRADFQEHFEVLFWDRDSYSVFKQEALQELRSYWYAHRSTVKEAIDALYQPAKERPVEADTGAGAETGLGAGTVGAGKAESPGGGSLGSLEGGSEGGGVGGGMGGGMGGKRLMSHVDSVGNLETMSALLEQQMERKRVDTLDTHDDPASAQAPPPPPPQDTPSPSLSLKKGLLHSHRDSVGNFQDKIFTMDSSPTAGAGGGGSSSGSSADGVRKASADVGVTAASVRTVAIPGIGGSYETKSMDAARIADIPDEMPEVF
ncbi:hypothetical protein B484DRAFT_204241 [Ochromonadaceae sp. CCMP2298]|nr:hypothetical protein B484DRAFT_204241 [Ochromonadaceae sp. CCMP2298]